MMTANKSPLTERSGGDGPCARFLDAHSLARALGGEVAGRDRHGPYIKAPGPGHSRQDRSLKVTICADAPDGFWVHTFSPKDDPLACRDYVRAQAGLPAWSPCSGSSAPPSRPRPPEKPQSYEEAERRDAWFRARVQAIWNEALNPRATIVERYLNEERGLLLPDDVAGTVLRFHPACPWKENGVTIYVPAMVAAMRAIEGDEIVSVHRTRLTPDGRKVERKRLGAGRDIAVKLDPDDAVTTGLVIGEGVETCLAARQLGFRPVWATGSSGGIQEFPVLPGVEVLTLLGEADANGANERAVNECGSRWHDAGRGVIVAAPLYGKDINDALRTGGVA